MFRHFDKKKRFEWKENEVVSFVSYLERDGRFILYHSEVPVEHRGKGIGRKMVEKTFEYLEENGIVASSSCSFIRSVALENAKWKKYI